MSMKERLPPPKFNSLPLKNGGLEDDPASYWVSATFQGHPLCDKLREGILNPSGGIPKESPTLGHVTIIEDPCVVIFTYMDGLILWQV